MTAPDDTSGQKPLLLFFTLVFLLSIPFWGLGFLAEKPDFIPVNLPLSFLMVYNPFLAALILTYRQEGKAGVRAFVRRAGDIRRIPNKFWLIPALLLVPAIYLLAYGIMRLTGQPLPEPQVNLGTVAVLSLAFFAGALGEEMGWTGYAAGPLQRRWGALGAALILGLVWAAWHFLGDLQAGSALGWIFWQRLYSTALRVIILWVHNNSGRSVFAAILVHASDNLGWALFPIYGSHYNPFYTALIAVPVAVLAAALSWRKNW